jgi:hypothetical protein
VYSPEIKSRRMLGELGGVDRVISDVNVKNLSKRGGVVPVLNTMQAHICTLSISRTSPLLRSVVCAQVTLVLDQNFNCVVRSLVRDHRCLT